MLVMCGSHARRRVLEQIASTHVRIVCVNPVKAWAADLVHDWIIAPCNDREASLSIVLKYVQDTAVQFDGLLCYDEFGLMLASELGLVLNLPFMQPSLVAACRDKFQFRQFCVANDIPSPRSFTLDRNIVCDPSSCALGHASPNVAEAEYFNNIEHVTERIEAACAFHKLTFPIVIKPTHGAGKICTRKANNAREAAEAVCQLHARMAFHMHRWRMTIDEARSMVVEEFMDGGPEIDADCIVRKVRFIFSRFSHTGRAYFYLREREPSPC